MNLWSSLGTVLLGVGAILTIIFSAIKDRASSPFSQADLVVKMMQTLIEDQQQQITQLRTDYEELKAKYEMLRKQVEEA